MSRLATLFTSLLAITLSLQPLAAQPAARAAKVSDLEQSEAAIRALEEQERAGVLAQDLAALERIWSEGFMVNAPMNLIAPNRDVVLDIFRKGLAHYTAFERRIEEIRIDGDIAIVMGAETVQPTGNAPRAGESIERRFTHIWRHDGSTWKLIARHANNTTSTT